MTRAQMAADLMTLVVRIGIAAAARICATRAAEWAYVKGLAAGEILRLRARLLESGEK